MELIASAVIAVASLIVVWITIRACNDRCERAEGTAHATISVNRDLSSVLLRQCEDANDRFAKATDVLIEIGEIAPERSRMELRRLELQYELEIERLQRVKGSESMGRRIEAFAGNHGDPGMSPVSQSTIED